MTTALTLVDNGGNQKISSAPPQETPATIVDNTIIEESFTKATDGTDSEMDSTIAMDKTFSTATNKFMNEELPTKIPFIEEVTSLIPAPATTNYIYAEAFSIVQQF
jgi:hypothetical protein